MINWLKQETSEVSIHWFKVADGDGKEAHMILWNHPGVDVTGMVGRCEKVAGSCEQVLLP